MEHVEELFKNHQELYHKLTTSRETLAASEKRKNLAEEMYVDLA